MREELSRVGGREGYDTDLTDAEWALLAPLLPPHPAGRGRPRGADLREVLNALLYLARTGCAWRLLPHDLPEWPTVRYSFDRWQRDGTLERVNRALRRRVRVQLGREPEPSAGCLDSRSVKTAEGGEARGYDGAKRIAGRKRHILVDTEGFLLYAWVHGADLQDARGAEIVLENGLAESPTLTLIWADGGYDKVHLRAWAAENTTVALDVVRRPEGATGFVPLPRRWVVERTFARLSRYRRLAKDYERLIENSTAWLYLASIHILVRRSATLDAEPNTQLRDKAA